MNTPRRASAKRSVEALRFDEDPLHLGDPVGRVIDVAELARERLVAMPAQPGRDQRRVFRLASRSPFDRTRRIADPFAERTRVQRRFGKSRVAHRENVVARRDAGAAVADEFPTGRDAR